MLHPGWGYFGLASSHPGRDDDCVCTTVTVSIQLHQLRNSYNRPLRVYRTSVGRNIADVLRYLTLHEVAERVGITYNTAKGYLRKGVLPQADATIGHRFGWLPETVDTWMESRPGRGRRVRNSAHPAAVSPEVEAEKF